MASDAFTISPSIGPTCFPLEIFSPQDPNTFVLTTSYGPFSTAFVPSTPAPWDFVYPPGLITPAELTFQGITSPAPGVFRTSNAVVLRVRL